MIRSALSKIYGSLVGSKNFVYDHGFIDQHKISPKVLSVGNLTMGGTGKTPVVDLLLNRCQELEMATLVVSRNYKALATKACRVDVNHAAAAEFFGDEPTWLARRHPIVDVWVGPVKWETAEQACNEKKYDLVIVDDGFQHRALKRDHDIVVIDATAPFSEYELFPLGRAREPWESLHRAHCVLLTKTNWAQSMHLEKLRSRLRSTLDPKQICIEIEFHTELPSKLIPGQEVIAFAGVAQPKNFFEELERKGLRLRETFVFPDHARYTKKSLSPVIESANKNQLPLITTEKDEIKVAPLFPGAVETLKLNLKTGLPVESLDAFLR